MKMRFLTFGSATIFAIFLLSGSSAHAATTSTVPLSVLTLARGTTGTQESATTGASAGRVKSSDRGTTAAADVVLAPVHVGRLTAANEAKVIATSMSGLLTVPGTDVRLGYRLDPPAGSYELSGSTLKWLDPASGDTHLLSVTVQDAADLRVIPGCKVQATLADAKGSTLVSSATLHFTWGEEFYRYAANVSVPHVGEAPTTASLTVRIEAPTFRRGDKALGAFFQQPVVHTFPEIKLPAVAATTAGGIAPQGPGMFREGRRPFVAPTPYPGAAGATPRQSP